MERKILIVTHSGLAEGFKASLDFFMPDMYEITTICAFTKELYPQQAIEKYIDSQNPDTEILAFTDIMFGSVNQWLGVHMQRPHFHLFTGTNLPLLLAVISLTPGEYLTTEIINDAVATCNGSACYVNSFKSQSANPDDE